MSIKSTFQRAIKGLRDKRRQQAPESVQVVRPERRVVRPFDGAPRRNRAERRFLDIAVPRHAGRLRMRAEGKRDKRRQQAPESVQVVRPERRVVRPFDGAPRRNRAERRFLDIAVPRHAGRLRMRAEGKRDHRRRIARHRVRLLRYLDGPHARVRGRVTR